MFTSVLALQKVIMLGEKSSLSSKTMVISCRLGMFRYYISIWKLPNIFMHPYLEFAFLSTSFLPTPQIGLISEQSFPCRSPWARWSCLLSQRSQLTLERRLYMHAWVNMNIGRISAIFFPAISFNVYHPYILKCSLISVPCKIQGKQRAIIVYPLVTMGC